MNNVEQMVNQLRAVAAQAAGGSALQSTQEAGGAGDFAALLKSAVDEVNTAQMDAKQLTRQFETGDPDVNLQDVVLSLQKASLSFQTMVQVRNKLVSAYQEIMNMQVCSGALDGWPRRHKPYLPTSPKDSAHSRPLGKWVWRQRLLLPLPWWWACSSGQVRRITKSCFPICPSGMPARSRRPLNR